MLKLFKGQSAIEYLTTYGWMLLVVAIVGGAIFTTVQNSSQIQSTSGLANADVQIEEFGVTGNGLETELRAASADQVENVNISLIDQSTGETVYSNQKATMPVGDTETVTFSDVGSSENTNTYDVEITYDTGGLEDLTAEGTITGRININGTIPAEIKEESSTQTTISSLGWGSSSDWDSAVNDSGVVHASYGSHSSTVVQIGYKNSDQGGENLIGYWPMDETSGATTISDASSNDYNGTNNTNLGSSGVLGTPAASFDGSTNYVDLSTHMSSLTTSNFTVCSWVKPNSFNFQGIFQMDHDWNQGDKSGWSMHIRNGEYRINVPNPSTRLKTSTGTTTNVWHHICSSYGDSGNVKLYVDGNEEASGGSGPSYDDDDYVTIGSFAPGGEDKSKEYSSFDGELDEVRLYSRELNSSEISSLYGRAAGSNNTLVTDWKNYDSDRDVVNMNLTDVNSTLKNQNITVKVQSDINGDDKKEEASSKISLTDSKDQYPVTGLSSSNDKFRLEINLSTSNVTTTPELEAINLEASG